MKANCSFPVNPKYVLVSPKARSAMARFDVPGTEDGGTNLDGITGPNSIERSLAKPENHGINLTEIIRIALDLIPQTSLQDSFPEDEHAKIKERLAKALELINPKSRKMQPKPVAVFLGTPKALAPKQGQQAAKAPDTKNLKGLSENQRTASYFTLSELHHLLNIINFLQVPVRAKLDKPTSKEDLAKLGPIAILKNSLFDEDAYREFSLAKNSFYNATERLNRALTFRRDLTTSLPEGGFDSHPLNSYKFPITGAVDFEQKSYKELLADLCKAIHYLLASFRKNIVDPFKARVDKSDLDIKKIKSDFQNGDYLSY